MTDVGILSLPSGSGALPISTIVGRGPSLRRVLGLDREGPPPRAPPRTRGIIYELAPPAKRDIIRRPPQIHSEGTGCRRRSSIAKTIPDPTNVTTAAYAACPHRHERRRQGFLVRFT